MLVKTPKALVNEADNGQFYYTIISSNGEVLVTSETFTQKHNATKGIWALIKACVKMWVKHKLGINVIEDKTK